MTESEAQSFADSFTAPGSALPTSEVVSDILATGGAACRVYVNLVAGLDPTAAPRRSD
jgi:hypothetical protein